MKRLLALVAAAALAVTLYAATATGGQQAVTPKQFAALKKQVTTLQKQVKTLTDFAEATVFCVFRGRAVPVNTATNWHTTGVGETQEFWALATTQADCANAINSPSFKRTAFSRLGH
jgi:mannose-1-phosphate guanylyltransferase